LKSKEYRKIEKYMHVCMNDGAHDSLHVYRVLYNCLIIADHYTVDMDVLIASALLHDIGRDAQFKDKRVDHAVYGSEMAYTFVLKMGWDPEKANHVKYCISAHRYRTNELPRTMEAKILFDSDKLEASGTLGIARTLAYKGIVSEPLYSISETGRVLNGEEDTNESFFQEYCFKLRNVYGKFYTKEARAMAQKRRRSSREFYNCILSEATEVHEQGMMFLHKAIKDI
jgi:uncharacterized protein